MKSVKEYLEDVAFGTVYTLMAMPLVLGIYQAHHSGFVRNYNQAIVRNADIDKDGTVTSAEELKIRNILHNEIAELGQEGHDLDHIVDWLKTR